MENPIIKNIISDETADITYNVIAYKKLSRSEMAEAVQYFHSQKNKPKLKKGITKPIVTTMGFDS